MDVFPRLTFLSCVCFQGSYSDLYPDSDDSSEDQIENSKNTWSCKVQHSSDAKVQTNELKDG